jgi:serine/threonine protein kinase
MNILGSGSEGNVYLLKNKKVLKHRKSNKNNKEFRIQQMLYAVAPESIIRPIDQFRTLNGHPIFLMDYLNAKNTISYPNITRSLICDVLKILDKIHKVYPSFRHNDLNPTNVLITSDGKPYINDFGLSFIDLPMMNYVKVSEKYGIVPGNDIRYDYHFFINSLHFYTKDEKIKKLIEKALPPEYIGMESPYVNMFRLRHDVKHTNLPSRTNLIKIFCD